MAEYIDKNATVGILEAMSRSADCECIKKRLEKAAKRVSVIPVADVAPVVHGRWIPFHSEAAGDIQYCSICGIGFDAKTDYCPHCGAKMGIKDGGDNDAVD